MPPLQVLKSQQQPLEFILPRKRPLRSIPQGMDIGIEQPFPSALDGLPIARVLFDIRNHTGIKDHFTIRLRIEPAIEVEIGTLKL